MDSILTIIVWSAIIYRIATDVTVMDGPFEVFTWYRTIVAQTFGPVHWVTVGATCAICVSFWLSVVVAVAFGDYHLLACAGIVAYAVRSIP
jgi:hypothetical protein